MSALRSIGKVVFPSLMAIVSLTVNILINAVFIFGLLGMPKLGVTGVAANAVVVKVVNIGAIAMRGFANATTILIGQTLGANLIEKTKEYARKLIWLTVYVAVAGCIIIVALRPFIMKFYSDKLTEVA